MLRDMDSLQRNLDLFCFIESEINGIRIAGTSEIRLEIFARPIRPQWTQMACPSSRVAVNCYGFYGDWKE